MSKREERLRREDTITDGRNTQSSLEGTIHYAYTVWNKGDLHRANTRTISKR